MNLFFDLDGTLIDSRPRLYHLFQKLVPVSQLSYDNYWDFKRDKVSNETILASVYGYGVAEIESFVIDWMKTIETPELLALDKNFHGIHSALERLGKHAMLHVCTARQHRQAAIEQLDRLGLLHFFNSVMVTEQRRGKEELIASVDGLCPQDWIIGDTGKDIQVGQALGIKTCAVLSGFLSLKSLCPYHPDLILKSAIEFTL